MVLRLLIDWFRAIGGDGRQELPECAHLEMEPSLFDGLERRRHWAWSGGSSAAQARGMRLLGENLTPAQRAQYAKHEYFDVLGGESGRRYRIRHGFQSNVEQLDSKGRPQRLLCFMPEGDLVIGDVMLAQKLALELFELQTLEVANSFPPYSRISQLNFSHYRGAAGG
jgi:hypothetical protein